MQPRALRHASMRLERARLAFSALTDLVFPPRCVGCNRAGMLFCDACAQAVEPLPRPHCPRCGQPQPTSALCSPCGLRSADPVTMARAAAVFAPPLRPAIHALKYANQPRIAPSLARYLVAAFADPEWQRASIDAVAPVPLHPERLAERGYNQSELLADCFCRSVGVPLFTTWLTRHRATRPQVGLNMRERQHNVNDSFTATAAVAGKRLLLIDDVYTTGATLRACAAAARAAGAADVMALTLARPLLPPHEIDPLHI